MKKIFEPKAVIQLWAPPVIWAILIFSFSSFPTPKTSAIYWQDFIVKKTAHLLEYGVFAVLLYRALKESGLSKKKAGLAAIVIVFFYGITDEYHQSFTPGREPRIRDVIIDTIGASLAIYLIWRLLPKAPEKLRNWAKNWQLL